MLATEQERRSEGNFQVTEFAQETLPPTEQLEAHSPSFPLLQRCFLCSLLLLLHILAEAAGIFYSPLQPQIHSWGKVLGFTKQVELPWVFLRAFSTGILPGQPVVAESLEGIPTPASSLGGAPPVGPACANLLQLPLTT